MEQRCGWCPQTLRRALWPLKGSMPSQHCLAALQPQLCLPPPPCWERAKRWCAACTEQRCCHHVSASPTHRITTGHGGGRISAWMQTWDVDQENAPLGFWFYFFPCDYRHIQIFSEKNDALFSHRRKESTTEGSVIGVSKPLLQRGRSLVICSWLVA